MDGTVLGTFQGPEALVTGAEGLAPFHDRLLYLGAGAFPRLYWLDPDTGDVLDSVYLWSGSGIYGDVAVLRGRAFISDLVDNALHELDVRTLQVLRTIDVPSAGGVTLAGPLAALAGPHRLYVADASPGGAIHTVNPATGGLTASMAAAFPCPCNADFDADDDVDADDVAFFDGCYVNDNTLRFGCGQTDLDCDGDHDGDDEAILLCQQAGPDVPPNPDCCSSGLPSATLRATGLGASGLDRLYVHDWLEDSIKVYDHDGNFTGAFPSSSPLGAIGGRSFAIFADTDADGRVNLSDFAPFVDCLTGPAGGPLPDMCSALDVEPDDDVDLDDFAAFQIAFTEGAQP